MSPKIIRISIIGLGLIGGSLGLAIKQKDLADKVVGLPRRQETADLALKIGAVDEASLDMPAMVSLSDIVFICTPINLIIPTLKQIAPYLKDGTIVTDVASTKEEIVAEAEKIIPKECFFVGGHPMAGKETKGLESASADLFGGATYILTYTSKTSKKALKKLEGFISPLGVKVIKMKPKLHDQVVAAISHLPLAAAISLVNMAAGSKSAEEMKQCAASGFRDTTRIASGDPVLAEDIFTTNKKAVLGAIKGFKKSLKELELAIKAGDKKKISGIVERANGFMDSIYNGYTDIRKNGTE